MRREILFNDDWRFHKGDIVVNRPIDKGPVYSQCKVDRKKIGPAAYSYHDLPDDYRDGYEIKSEGWEFCELPHDYIIKQDNDKTQNNAHGYFKYDNAWYRKHFTLPEDCENKRILLRFDGVTGNSTFYLNGCLMYHNFSAYNTFEIDITDVVFFDKENVLAVYLNVEEFEGWWYQGGGIYRDVHLVITEPVAIDLWGVYAPTQKISDKLWRVDLETTVVNTEYNDVSVSAETEIFDSDGNCVAVADGSGEISSREKRILRYSCDITSPLLWDCENPNLYTVKTVLKMGEKNIDENTTRIGFRTVELDTEKGLLLNGKKTIIKGVCAHQDFGLTGIAVPDNIIKYKMQLIKDMGANGYRTSHYQQTAAYLDACDELGLLVMDEARWFESTKEAFQQLESLLLRDRNRPSVIFWSTGNEEPFYATENGRRLHKAIYAHIRKFDKNRIITAAVSHHPDKCQIYADCDLIGINYNLELYDGVHEAYPEKLIVASECCATGTTRDWNFPTELDGRRQDYDVIVNSWFQAREKTWKFLMSKPYVIGGYQWAAVEHRGEAMWPAVCSKSGALDLFLQRKGAFYQNKSHWTDEPMVHIVPHWNFKGLEGKEIPVTVYTNCDELELFLNGESQGKKTIERYGRGEWKVVYTPGKLEVKGYRDGKLCATDTRITTGRPETLRLTMDNTCVANGQDIALFTCECLDIDGNVVPDAAEFVKFSVNEPAKIIGTGSDHCDHNNVTLPERKMYMGKIRIAVKPNKNQTDLCLTAMSDNCGYTFLKVKLPTE
ncbi:MAG: glycoside hydrolase family 2 protein [Ruminococcaceae bacterium]|nr:glycoside hydrolase family 2 protein [Oscillospiraceae bacterium]